MKMFRSEISPNSKYEEFKSHIDKAASQNPKIDKIKVEMREKLFEEFLQNHFKTGGDLTKHHEDEASESEEKKLNKKRKGSKSLNENELDLQKKVKSEHNLSQERKNNNSGEINNNLRSLPMRIKGEEGELIEEEGEIQDEK